MFETVAVSAAEERLAQAQLRALGDGCDPKGDPVDERREEEETLPVGGDEHLSLRRPAVVVVPVERLRLVVAGQRRAANLAVVGERDDLAVTLAGVARALPVFFGEGAATGHRLTFR